jgi:outer membrane cobalamin receptor
MSDKHMSFGKLIDGVQRMHKGLTDGASAIVKVGLISLIGTTAVFAESPEVLINAQGLAQQDLSVRGSSYTGAGISINGLNLKNPYSAHYSAGFPTYSDLLADAGIRLGRDNHSGHLLGTVALNTQPLEAHTSASVGIGSDERYQTSVSSSSSSLGGSFDWEKARSIDHDANGMERSSGAAFAQFFRDDWQFDLQSAGQTTDNGAQGYYGIPQNVYAEEQIDTALLLASAFKGDLDSSFMRTGLLLQESDHEYRIPSASFSSDVHSRYGSVMAEGRTLEIQDIALNLRGDLEHEHVSGDLGQHDRTRGSLLLLPQLRLERLTFKAGLNSVFQTDEAAEWLPQVGVDFFASDNLKLYAAYTESVQQPEYQMLYYSDPYHTGDDTLPMQQMHSIELGLHQFLSAELDWRASVFHRRQKHAWDWVKSAATDTAWTATDLGALDVTGIEAKLNYAASDTLKLELYYQWITKDEYDLYAGLYELDYPEHLLKLAGHWQLSPELRLSGSQTLRVQSDNPVRTGDDFGYEASLGLHYDPRFANNVSLSFLVENLWDSDFQAIPGLKPRPITASAGMTVTW